VQVFILIMYLYIWKIPFKRSWR